MTLELMVMVNDGETLDDVARELVGPKGKATYEVLGLLPGDQWPTLRFTGTVNQLVAICAVARQFGRTCTPA